MVTQETYEEYAAPLIPKATELERMVREALVAAGHHEYVYPEMVPGFMVMYILPQPLFEEARGLYWVNLQYVAGDGDDLRPMIAEYCTCLDRAGLPYEVVSFANDEMQPQIEVYSAGTQLQEEGTHGKQE